MPIWPFAKGPTTSALDEIDEDTPHRVRFWLADGADRQTAASTLTGRLSGELTFEAETEADGRVRFDVASIFSPRIAAIMRPLNALQQAGIDVHGFDALDLVTDLDEGNLHRAVAAWGEFANRGPHRHRLEVLAGMPMLEMCLALMRRATDAGPDRPASWRFAAGCIAFNTPTAEGRMLAEAAETAGWLEATDHLDAATSRAELSRSANVPLVLPHAALAALIRRPDYVSERASELASLMPSPLPDEVTQALCATASGGGDRAMHALGALWQAEPSGPVRATIDAALVKSDPNVQAAALGALAHHWGTEARLSWQDFLASRSAPLRQTAEAVIGLHGTAEDLPAAAAHLAKLARTKSVTPLSPPRGAEIVDLLVRHRGHQVARAGLDDLSARWDRLGGDLRQWLTEHHAWLDPARRGDRPVEQPAESEPVLAWPAPSIERDGDRLVLWFAEDGHTDARARFEVVADAHPLVEVLDGDREWLSVRIASDEPEVIVRQLWESVGPLR